MLELSTEHRDNLLKLANYLESLPKNYEHFGMRWYVSHLGSCEIDERADTFAKDPKAYVTNCGTVACALGHAPAAGIGNPEDFVRSGSGDPNECFNWNEYCTEVFGIGYSDGCHEIWNFLFSGEWAGTDNTHYGAAARIRYFLDGGNTALYPWSGEDVTRKYVSYRKGNKRWRELTAATVH